jgi:hypothetical protein
MPDWSLERDAAGRGVVRHLTPPRFTARWTSGDADLTGIDGPGWGDPGSGDGEDGLHLHGFRWIDSAPDEETFERLMRAAVQAIDAWIASRL